LEDQSESKDLKIVHDVPGEIQVLCDPDQTRRVLVNLLHNAVKWSPQGETINVRAVNGGDEVIVSVVDHGPGVPDDQVERIFERFYQVDPSRSEQGGTGLGLAICKHIVEAHDGRIWAEGNSQSPGGRFMFTLPSAN
jgi:two-component system phosphate regulon sensor histidine kinase PhoR